MNARDRRNCRPRPGETVARCDALGLVAVGLAHAFPLLGRRCMPLEPWSSSDTTVSRSRGQSTHDGESVHRPPTRCTDTSRRYERTYAPQRPRRRGQGAKRKDDRPVPRPADRLEFKDRLRALMDRVDSLEQQNDNLRERLQSDTRVIQSNTRTDSTDDDRRGDTPSSFF